jgi:uncharacterized protein
MNDQNDNRIVENSDRTLAIFAHVGAIFFPLLAPFLIYLIKKGENPDSFSVDQAREALNFQITCTIGMMIGAVLSLILIGIFIVYGLIMANFILCIIAAIKASDGVRYRYPMTLRLIR